MDKAPPWIGSSGSSSIEDFWKEGKQLLQTTTTLIVVNVGSIRRFVDLQVERIP
jgi:hypothetical protein